MFKEKAVEALKSAGLKITKHVYGLLSI